MRQEERKILQSLVSHPKGLLSPAEMINGVAKRDKRSVQNLIAEGYIVEVPTQIATGAVYPFYRATEKGIIVCGSLYGKIWYFCKNHFISVLVSVITTLVTVALTNLLGNGSK